MEKFDGDGLESVREGIAQAQADALAKGVAIHYYIGQRLVEHRPDGTILDVKHPIKMNCSYDTP